LISADWIHYRALVFCQEFFDELKNLKKHTLKFPQLWFTRQILVDGLLAVEENADIAWFWTGTHAECDRLLKGR